MHTLYGSLKLSNVKHVIITHHHKDHFAPDDLFKSYPPLPIQMKTVFFIFMVMRKFTKV